MKTIHHLLLYSFIGFAHFLPGQNLEFIRSNYAKAATSEKICKTLISALSGTNNTAVETGYLGALKAISANYTSNPFSKLSSFIEGKNKIETAINSSPENVELRFIRLSIQQNCPGFLGYSGNINTDKEFIRSNIASVTSPVLKKMCLDLINTK